jgi:glutamine amidotransferase-like uncharacterized protein
MSANKFLTDTVSVSTGERVCIIGSFNADLGKSSGYANVMGMNEEGENLLDLCTGNKWITRKAQFQKPTSHKIASHSTDRMYGSTTDYTAITKSLKKEPNNVTVMPS